ncbi:MAG: hypothetical protein HDS38_00825 [Bacteroides sp.]|nr:hypothetical protein [Bacteroides sp.]
MQLRLMGKLLLIEAAFMLMPLAVCLWMHESDWRALTQWIGGLGIVLFLLAVLPSLNNSKGLFMFHAETSGITHDKIGARISNTAVSIPASRWCSSSCCG